MLTKNVLLAGLGFVGLVLLIIVSISTDSGSTSAGSAKSRVVMPPLGQRSGISVDATSLPNPNPHHIRPNVPYRPRQRQSHNFPSSTRHNFALYSGSYPSIAGSGLVQRVQAVPDNRNQLPLLDELANTDLSGLRVALMGGGAGVLALARFLYLSGVDVAVFATEQELKGSHQSVLVEDVPLNIFRVIDKEVFHELEPMLRPQHIPCPGVRNAETTDWLVELALEIEGLKTTAVPGSSITHADLLSVLRRSLPKGTIHTNVQPKVAVKNDKVLVSTDDGNVFVADFLFKSVTDLTPNSPKSDDTVPQDTPSSSMQVLSGVVYWEGIPFLYSNIEPDLGGLYVDTNSNVMLLVTDIGSNLGYEWKAFIPSTATTQSPTHTLASLMDSKTSPFRAWAAPLQKLFAETDVFSVEQMTLSPALLSPSALPLSSSSLSSMVLPSVSSLLSSPTQHLHPVGLLDETSASQAIVDAFFLLLELPGTGENINAKLNRFAHGNIVRAVTLRSFSQFVESRLRDAGVEQIIPLEILDHSLQELHLTWGQPIRNAIAPVSKPSIE
eukprot:c26061_g1_i1.p1 GENE.c26061_g1_i1~~c26061_g1_i1.p1  ORF type:complete len:554 (-),score=153.53 c26061_g1_i1:78-1739(-)